MASPSIQILLVEDNPGHQRITEYILKKSNIDAELRVVRDGQEVLDYLFHEGVYADADQSPRPDLILLDFNLPKHDGKEVLKIIKQDPRLKNIPVVIVSTSDREEDMNFAFELGAASYISKASGFEKFSAELAGVTRFVHGAGGNQH